jgi:S-adenosylmethionine/arginine decarboxylase-like enzyme
MLVTSNPTRHALYFDAVMKRGELLASAEFLEQLARDSAAVAGMRILDLRVHYVEEDLTKLGSEAFEDEGGLSLYALLSTSHLSIHGWPNRAVVMFDLVSCRAFDQAAVETLIRSRLDVRCIIHNGRTDVSWPLFERADDRQRWDREAFDQRHQQRHHSRR